VCDVRRRFGRGGPANSLSDVFAMGGRPLFALNLCCFPKAVPQELLTGILRGASEALAETGAALLGGHTVQDKELKFGLAVVGVADPERLLTLAKARPGDRLLLTKPVGTGVIINGFKADKLDEQALEPALVEMERLNDEASRLALKHGVHACTDVTGFGLVGHALNMARESGATLTLEFDKIPAHEAFYRGVAEGVSTGSTKPNRRNVEDRLEIRRELSAAQSELLVDPQTSGGLLLSVPTERAPGLLEALLQSGHRAAEIGCVAAGPVRIVVA
jgi:selenide,water dikinase